MKAEERAGAAKKARTGNKACTDKNKRYASGLPAAAVLTIIMSMALFFSACSFSAFIQKPSASQEPEASPAPETVNTVQAAFTTVSGNTAQLVPLAVDGNFYYCLSQEKTGESIPEEAVKAAKKKKKEATNDGRYDTFSYALYKLRPNGSMYRLPDYVSVAPEDNTGEWSDFSSVVSVDALRVNDDGTFTILEHTATSGNSMPKDKTKYQAGKNYLEYVLKYYLRTLTRSGAEKSCVEISPEDAENLLKAEFPGSSLSREYNDVLDSSGTVLFSLSDAGINPAECCSDVTELFSGETSDNKTTDNKATDNKTVAAENAAASDLTVVRKFRCLCETYNTETRKYTYKIARISLRTVPAEECTVLRLGYTDTVPGGRLLETVASFNRKHEDISVRLVPFSADTYKAAGSGMGSGTSGSEPDFDASGTPGSANAVNDSAGADGSDNSDASGTARNSLTELQKENLQENLTEENLPDLLYIDNQLCTDLAFSGALADLYPYLDADRSLNREDYFPNILAAAERNGILCSTCAGFTVNTVIGEASVVGERCSWNYDELREAWGNLGIGTDAFHAYTEREDVLRACLKTDLSSIVSYDVESDVYRVDSDKLSQLQWFCGNFPEAFDYSGRTLAAADATDLRLRNGKQLLLPAQLCSFEDLKLCGYAFRGEIAFVGYPTLDGCGSTLTVTTLDPDRNFSMTSSCPDPQAAWEFLRTFFTASYQTAQYKAENFFPSQIRCFERGMKAATSGEYAVDKNGELVYDKNNNLIHVSLGTLYLSDYTEVRYYPVSEQRAASFRTLVESLTKTETSLPDAGSIVEELCRIQ